jgi:hypothetical protein
MRTRLVGLALALALAPAALFPTRAGAAEPAVKPTAVLRLKPLEELLADARYLVALAGREEETRQIEGLLKAKSGPKGLEGLDTKKPIGLYGVLKNKLPESQGVLLLPIADEKTFLGLLERVNLKPEKDKTGLYTLEPEQIPFPVLFRFANNYLYATLKITDDGADALAKDKLPDPAAVLGGAGGSMVALTVHLERVPPMMRKMAVGFLAKALANAKDEDLPGETEAQKKLRAAMLDEAAVRAKELLTGGSSLALRLDLDRKTEDVSLALTLAGKPGSDLAKDIARLGLTRSVAASLIGPDSAMNAHVSVGLPEAVRRVLGPALDEAVKKAVAAEADKDKRELLAGLLEAVTPTAKAAELDAGFDVRGPGKSGLYTLVAGLKVKEGAALEKALKDVHAKLPPAERKKVAVDFDKAGGVHIHKATPDKVDEQTKELFGTNPVYFAVREDALLITAGEGGLAAMKEALAARPKAARPLQVELSLARMAKLMARRQKSAVEAAKQAFKAKGSDKLLLAVEAGESLRLRLSMKAQVVAFGSLIEKQEREAKEKGATKE